MRKIISGLFLFASFIQLANNLKHLPNNVLEKIQHAIPESNFSTVIRTLLNSHTIDLLLIGLEKNPKKIPQVVAAVLAHFFPPKSSEISGLKRELSRIITRVEKLEEEFSLSKEERAAISELLKIYFFGLNFYEQLKIFTEEHIAELLPHDARYNWLLQQHGKTH